MDSCVAIVLLLSPIAFSECFVHAGDMVFPAEDWEFRQLPTRQHPRDFYPGAKLTPADDSGDLSSYEKDTEDNIIPHGPPCSNDKVDELNSKGFKKENGYSETNEDYLPKTESSTEDFETFFRAHVPQSKIVGDFVFPDQVESFRKQFVPVDPTVKISVGMKRGVEEPADEFENRNNFGSGKCSVGQRKIGGICVPIGH